MSTSSSPSPIGSFPAELLERIFLLTSARDILRLSSVNRTFHGLVRTSPSIQYEVDLFGAGLERNPQTKTPLADCRKALAAYRGRWETLDPADKWDRAVYPVSTIELATAVSGTYGALWEDSIRFFTLGSVSRGIPGREWNIPFEHFEIRLFTFYPQANIAAVVEEVAWTWLIHLVTLSDGEPHPAAQTEVLSYTFNAPAANNFTGTDMSITGSRLAVLRGASNVPTVQVVVWDWTTGQILFELENRTYRSAKFVDDHWLALIFVSSAPAMPTGMVLLNTSQMTTDDPTLAQTMFYFDPDERSGLDMGTIFLHLDQGGHEPSPEESLLVPFYPAASQRVLAIEFSRCRYAYVMKTEVLLRLAQERGGTDLQWRKWRTHVVEVRLARDCVVVSISGPRLFCVNWAVQGTFLDVYDFSPQGSAGFVETITDRGGMVQQVKLLGIRRRRLPWDIVVTYLSSCGHDGITFVTGPESHDEDVSSGAFHVWSF